MQQSPFRPENCVNICKNTDQQKQLDVYFINISCDNGYRVTGGIHKAAKVKDLLKICGLSQSEKVFEKSWLNLMFYDVLHCYILVFYSF